MSWPVQGSLAGLAGETALVVGLVLAKHLLSVEHSRNNHLDVKKLSLCKIS